MSPRAADAVLALAVAAVGLAFAAMVEPRCLPGFDCNSYFQMAADPWRIPSFPPHHAGRVLPSLVAHLLGHAGMSIPAAFRLLAAVGYVALPLAAYALLRRTAGPAQAIAGTSWLWLAPWPILYVLFDNGQAGYLFALVALVAIRAAAERERLGAIAAAGLAGALCRQEVAIAAAAALGLVALRRRSWRPLGYAVAAVGPAVLVALGAAAGAHAPEVLRMGTASLSAGALLAAWTHPEVFLPAWTLVPAAVALRVRGGLRSDALAWLVPYALAVLLLDTSIVAIAGPENYGRIVLLGLWPLGLEVARAMSSRRLPVALWALVALLPAGYVVARRALAALEALGWRAPAYDAAIVAYGAVAPLVLGAILWFSAPREIAR